MPTPREIKTRAAATAAPMPSGAAHEPRLSLIAVGIIAAWFAIADIIDIVLKFFALDDFWILDILTWPIAALYFKLKGVSQTYNTVCGALELVPYVGALPMRTFGIIMVAYLDRHPKLEAAVLAVGSKLPSAKRGKPTGKLTPSSIPTPK